MTKIRRFYTSILAATFFLIGILLLSKIYAPDNPSIQFKKLAVNETNEISEIFPNKSHDISKMTSIDTAILRNSIDLAGQYLSGTVGDDGKFIYRVNINPNHTPSPKYNILRHAGTIYAMVMYQNYKPDDNILEAIFRAGKFLKSQTIKPIIDDHKLAVWSLPELNHSNKPKQAKLGATGLGLIALTSIEKLQPGFTNPDTLRRLGEFIVDMQKSNGSYYAKYIPSTGGKDDRWTSLYYPGEAALGLLMLYEIDPNPLWLQTAASTIGYLFEIRKSRTIVEADHWALLATSKLLKHYHEVPLPVKREDIISHAVKISNSILLTKSDYSDNSPFFGGFVNDGRTTPTATRSEGLLAALSFLPEENATIINSAVIEGIYFLINAQIKSGEFIGGIPRAVKLLSKNDPGYKKSFNRRATEIRIDYVQHALSAMIIYDQIFD